MTRTKASSYTTAARSRKTRSGLIEFNTNRSAYMLTFPKLIELEQLILTDWKAGSPVVVRAGIQSGKTTLVRSLIQKFPTVVIFGPSNRILQNSYPKSLTSHVRHYGDNSHFTRFLLQNEADYEDHQEHLRKLAEEIASKEHCIIIDEYNFLIYSQQLFEVVSQRYKNILVIGSRGYYKAWDGPITYSYSTWDLNPTMSPVHHSTLIHFNDDFRRAYRDYGVEDANNDDHYEFFMTWQDIKNSR